MGKYFTQSMSADLAMLQGAGWGDSGDFLMGPALPKDSIVLGMQIDVTEALAGPGLTGARATINLWPGSVTQTEVRADLMVVNQYESGGQQFRLQVWLDGCTMAQLTAGSLSAAVFYDQFKL